MSSAISFSFCKSESKILSHGKVFISLSANASNYLKHNAQNIVVS